MSWAIGLDPGQAKDFAALVAVEGVGSMRYARHVERMRLGTAYTSVAARAGAILDAVPEPRELVADGTGVGRAVVDIVRGQGKALLPISITSGKAVTEGDRGFLNVPKAHLVRVVVATLEAGELRIAKSLPFAPALQSELKAFRASRTASGHTAFGGVGEHDDILLALALALWRLGPGAGLIPSRVEAA